MLRNTSLRVNVSSHRYAHIMHAGHGVAQRASEDQRWDSRFRRGRAFLKKTEMVTVMVTGAMGAFEGHISTGFIFRLYFIGL
jgi:hypothetical protein